MKYHLVFMFLLAGIITESMAQNKSDQPPRKTTGVSVSPSHFHFRQDRGDVKTYDITIKNSTSTAKEFNINIYDFEMNSNGKSSFIPAGTGKFSLAKWMSISPTFVMLKPFENKKVKVTVSIPTNNRKKAWSILMIGNKRPEKNYSTKKDGNTVAMGVIPTFAFGVFAYQNPPNVTDNKVEFTNFQLKDSDKSKYLRIEVQNQGDGIAYCTSYIDLTNLDTGEQQRLKVKNFTIVPELIRDFNFFPLLAQGKVLSNWSSRLRKFGGNSSGKNGIRN